MSRVIGIDLGTTNSCVAYMEGAEAKIVPIAEGTRTVPSVVSFTDDDIKIIGNTAKRQIITNPKRSFYSIKRLIGKKYNSEEVKILKNKVTYDIIEAENGDIRLKTEQKEYSPQEISAYLLMYLRDSAEEYLGEEIEDVIITVPANFDDSQRQATKDAATIAGLNVLRIINEPTAACLAYGFHKQQEGTIFVYDLGGGTFDVSILEISEGVFKVLSTRGDSFLGGNDFDRRIVDWLIEDFKNENGVDLSLEPFVYQRIMEVAEKAKMELSYTNETEINLPYVYVDESGPKHIVKKLTRKKLEELTYDIVEQTIPYIKEALEKANMTYKNIDEIILVGGQSRMPLVKRKVEEFFEKTPRSDINPDEVVAMGAAVQSAILKGEIKDIVLLDVTPLSLGIETKGDVFTRIIPMNTTIPVKKQKIFTTVSDNQSVVKIHVLQGEREVASQNRSLGWFELIDIPPAPKGVPQIIVTFEIDSDGIVKVSAKDQRSGHEQKIVINPTSGLTPEEIQAMKEDAEKYKEKDIYRKNLIKERNSLTIIYDAISHSFNNLKSRMKQEDYNEINEYLEKVRDMLDSDDLEGLTKIRTEGEYLQEKLYDIINEIYNKGILGANNKIEEDKKEPEDEK